MLKALLFDLDGTLANTDPVHFAVWQEIMQTYGLSIDRPFYDSRFSGRLNVEIIQDLLPQLTVEASEQLSWNKEATFRQRARQMFPTTGVLELLDWADQQGLKQAVVTNAPRENAEFMLETLQLSDRFSLVVLGEELEMGKPDPMPYQVAMAQLGVTAAETVAFEDSPSGMRSAVGAGIATVGVASTHSSDTLLDLGATVVIQDFTEWPLHDWLRSLLQHEPVSSP